MGWGRREEVAFWVAGALAGPVTAYIYDWNMLPIGQVLWVKELESYKEFPPLQDPASYNLDQVMEQLKAGRCGTCGGGHLEAGMPTERFCERHDRACDMRAPAGWRQLTCKPDNPFAQEI